MMRRKFTATCTTHTLICLPCVIICAALGGWLGMASGLIAIALDLRIRATPPQQEPK